MRSVFVAGTEYDVAVSIGAEELADESPPVRHFDFHAGVEPGLQLESSLRLALQLEDSAINGR